MGSNKDLYFVAVKVFLEDGKGNFLITKDKFGDWDIPGGRLRDQDFSTPLEKVAQRKMTEELGTEIVYELGKPILHMRHERDEILSDGTREKRRIFAIGYSAVYKGGNITLGKNHEKHEWVSIKDFKPESYFKGGWLQGVKDFQSHKRNLKR